MARSLFSKRRFADEAAADAPAPAAETTTEESAPDSQTQFVQLLTDMGLSAEQAEAVYQMAQDLVNAGGAEQPAKTEASRIRRARMARRERMLNRSRGLYGNAEERRFSTERRPVRERLAREERFAREERPTRQARPARFARQERTDLASRVISRQRQQIQQLRQELAAMGKRPDAQKLSRAPQVANQNISIPTEGSVKDRVFNSLKNWL